MGAANSFFRLGADRFETKPIVSTAEMSHKMTFVDFPEFLNGEGQMKETDSRQ